MRECDKMGYKELRKCVVCGNKFVVRHGLQSRCEQHKVKIHAEQEQIIRVPTYEEESED